MATSLKSGNVFAKFRNALSHTVLSKLLVTYIMIMLLMLAVQSLLLGTIYQEQYRQDRQQALEKEATDLAQLYADYLTNPDAYVGFNLNKTVYSVASRQNATIWFVDSMGVTVEMTPNSETSGGTGNTVPEFKKLNDVGTAEFNADFRSIMRTGKTIWKQGEFFEQFGSEVLSVGVPILSGNVPIGALFIHTKMQALNVAIGRMYRQIATSAAVALALGVIMISLMSTRLSRPLVQMNEIAGYIAKGNFDRRAEAKTRDEIGQLAKSFNAMAEELKKQEDLRAGFVANVSHELRSPLTSIHGFAQGMLDGTISAEDHQKYLGVIVGESRRLTKLIKELLDLSQIESGKFPLNIQPFDVNELISRVLITFEEKIVEKKLEIEVDFRQDKAVVMADSDRIEQVVINLLDNAVKFTEEGGRIKIWTHGTSDRILIGIADTGPGIPEEDQPYVWERFYKVDKSHTGKKGTGLGLSIVKKIIDQHGERITLQSQPGSGAVFTFSLKKPE